MSENELETFLPEILDLEAIMLVEFLGQAPLLKERSKALSSIERAAGEAYVKSILQSCYRDDNLRFSIVHGDGELYGYAAMFGGGSAGPVYLHRLFVKEQFQERGLGRQLLQPLFALGRGINLIAPLSRVGFFERSGLKLLDTFYIPSNPAFGLLMGHYAPDYFLMGDQKYPGGAPIFLLNDDDLKQIFGIV